MTLGQSCHTQSYDEEKGAPPGRRGCGEVTVAAHSGEREIQCSEMSWGEKWHLGAQCEQNDSDSS